MRKVNRSALVPYSAVEMFALVEDVESYPEFLPWCNDVELHERQENIVEATLELHRGSISRHFRTRNTSVAGQSMDIVLVHGPFRHFGGEWTFQQLGDLGCKVTLAIDFEFESRLLEKALGKFFEETCNSLVDAFVRRANAIHGADKQ